MSDYESDERNIPNWFSWTRPDTPGKRIIYVLGNEEGHVYSPTPNTIYVREYFATGDYGKTHSVKIPKRYQGIPFRNGECVFIVFEEDGEAYFNGKDFRSHISDVPPP